ncbi:lytic murein transglycosylase [Novosphingobium kunmingense]|nr:lytic murein transglycosylase [Novosphingobium kunmingense]
MAVPALAVLVVFSAPTLPASAQVEISQDQAFQGYLQLLAARARREGVSEATIGRMTSGLTFNPRVVVLDQSQPGSNSAPGTFEPFAPYYRDHVDAARIIGGKRTLAANSDRLPQIEAQYGVPGKILVAIWGHETNYGSYKGDFDLARSLATLAYEGRRRELFAGEFIALLKMVDRGVPRERLYGSWAGAFGNPQFLPSVYLRVAQDGDGDGDADIWNDRADTLASIANYFRDAGWRRGEPWGVKAFVPAGLDRSSLTTRLDAPSCPRVHLRHSAWKPVSEWRALGVIPQGVIADRTLATLLEPDGAGSGGFLLTGNYRVILQYNCSNYYALSVGLLADEIAR